MNIMKNLLIRTKLLVMIIVSITGFIIYGILSYYSIEKLKVNGTLYNKIIQGKDIIADVLPPPSYIIETYLTTLEMANTKNEQELKVLIAEYKNLKNEYFKQHTFWKDTLQNGEIKTLMVEASANPAKEFFHKTDSIFIPLLLDMQYTEAKTFLESTLKPLYSAHRQQVDKLVVKANIRNKQIENEASEIIEYFYALLTILSISIIIITLLISYYIFRSISKPIKKGIVFAEKISNGDLTAQLTLTGNDEIGQLARSLQQMANRIHPIIEGIIAGTENILNSSSEIGATSEQMAQGAGEQAASVETISASIETMTESIAENQKSIQETENITNKAVVEIQKSNNQLSQNIMALTTIVNKVQIISDIADKTDLLAINAAIEASRAGEHGKGFGVVASEIRKLADLSQQAAKEIDLITKKSLQTAEFSGKSFEDIVKLIQKTAISVEKITTASLEQTSSTSYINSSIGQLNLLAQQNAAASEELATSSSEMKAQAEHLKSMISFFKIRKR